MRTPACLTLDFPNPRDQYSKRCPTAPVLLQGSSNLTDWVTVQVLDPARSHTVELPVANRPAQFFRVCPER